MIFKFALCIREMHFVSVDCWNLMLYKLHITEAIILWGKELCCLSGEGRRMNEYVCVMCGCVDECVCVCARTFSCNNRNCQLHGVNDLY